MNKIEEELNALSIGVERMQSTIMEIKGHIDLMKVDLLDCFKKAAAGDGAVCWLCSRTGAETEITVECETPGGEPCPPKQVEVHMGCYMDITP